MRCSGCWPHDGEAAGGAVADFHFSSSSGLARPTAHETLLLCGYVVGTEVGILLVRLSPSFSWTRGSLSTSDCRHGRHRLRSTLLRVLIYGDPTPARSAALVPAPVELKEIFAHRHRNERDRSKRSGEGYSRRK
jgi:hypothetical protein